MSFNRILQLVYRIVFARYPHVKGRYHGPFIVNLLAEITWSDLAFSSYILLAWLDESTLKLDSENAWGQDPAMSLRLGY